jgi:NAD(P)-dependent dehydrogenase (short-subunit alcohol dehydrogenase family)
MQAAVDRRTELTNSWNVLFLTCALTWQTATADTVLITGANSGIGLEFATQYAADGWQVIATHRRDSTPESLEKLTSQYDNVQIETIDVTDAETIAAAAARLQGIPIDILINNAGIVGTFKDTRQHFGSLDYDLLHRFIDVNAAGPLRVSEAFYENVAASKQKRIVAISTAAGSLAIIDQGRGKGLPLTVRYWYNMSKVALNMAFLQLSETAADDGVSVATYHPGLVRVARTATYELPEQFKAMAIDVDESVTALRQRFSELTLETSGGFISYNGEQMPW